MNYKLLEILTCPIYKTGFDAEVTLRDNDENIEGTLYCKECDVIYKIEDSIPKLLPESVERRIR